jgi:hypothetical protein
MTGRSAYPRYFKTQSGRSVSIATMSKALRAIRLNPSADYPGWEWYSLPGHYILRSFRDGMHDRINLRGTQTGERP